MPRAHLLVESPIRSSFRVEQVRGMFDVPDKTTIRHEWDVNLAIEEKPWRIGLIVGPSGSGKTTIGTRLFPDALFHRGYDWPEESAVVDGFASHFEGKQITQALSSVGFSSPPHWLKRFSHLSNGQKFRCELARVILEDATTVVFDEFTSVVDRDAARVSSAAVASAIRRQSKPNLVALSCHYDIIDWLDPDWVFDTANMQFSWRLLQGRPEICLRIHQAKPDAWSLFRGHHYLSKDLNKAAQCFVATWNGNPVGFTSFLHFPHPVLKNTKREHRTVVLPDFQGVGIGNRLSEWLGSHAAVNGFRFRSTTSHPAMIRHRLKSKLWSLQNSGHVLCGIKTVSDTSKLALKKSFSTCRVTASFEYRGGANPASTLNIPKNGV